MSRIVGREFADRLETPRGTERGSAARRAIRILTGQNIAAIARFHRRHVDLELLQRVQHVVGVLDPTVALRRDRQRAKRQRADQKQRYDRDRKRGERAPIAPGPPPDRGLRLRGQSVRYRTKRERRASVLAVYKIRMIGMAGQLLPPECNDR